MAERRIDNILQALDQRLLPAVTLWNRLEGRPRSDNFDRALKAEVRDPLWLLAKQWQMGEFEGDDAGSPVFAKIHLASSRLNRYQPDGHDGQPFDPNVPLEAQVEQRPIALTIGAQKMSLDLRLLMGRQWLKLIRPVGDLAQAYVDKYPIEMPDPNSEADAPIYAHGAVWQQVAAVAGRAMDGAALYYYLKEAPTHHAYDDIPMSAAQQSEIDQIATKFIQWFESLFYQPQTPEQNAWRPDYLEYQFSVAAPATGGESVVLTAEEYYHGRLEWYNLDVDGQRDSLDGEAEPTTLADVSQPTQSFIPTPLVFDGMPHTRWWTFEDRRTNFGDIQPGTTDLSKLLLIEFGLVYANDWFLFPLALPTGTLTEIRGLAITNVFGERFWIEPAGRGGDSDWERWSMFTLTTRGDEAQPADLRYLLLPTVPKIQEGDPLEEVRFIRDEVANMVWGIESMIPMPDGSTIAGLEAAYEIRNAYQRLIDQAVEAGTITPAPLMASAAIRYQVMPNNIPENWIPFIPVHIPGDNREIQLQRAALPRILANAPSPPPKVRPRTVLLRQGLDRVPAEPYFIHEEEVPRAGVRITQSFQRTRWRNGRTFVWLGIRKQSGRGEGASNLVFDQIVPAEQAGT